jgi:ATP-dependent Lon protease
MENVGCERQCEGAGAGMEHVDPIFFGDPKTAAFKALGLN